MAGFGFGVSDLVSVSNLAFKLYRRCRDAPKEFNSLTNEVANLRNLVDDVRLSVKEHSLSETQTDHLLDIGQCCLDCLVDLEELLQKHGSLGIKTIRGLERLKWDKNQVSEIRQKLVSNISLLTAFNTNLTRSSTVRLEKLLRGFLEDLRAGRHEGSIVSKQTLSSIQRGDDDVWRELKKELETAGITEEQITEHKQMITQRIVDTIQSLVEQGSTVSRSFHSAIEGGSGHQWFSPTMKTKCVAPELDFPGPEFHWAMAVIKSLVDLFTDAPEDYIPIQEELSQTKIILTKVDEVLVDLSSLSYHEKLCRKPRMAPALDKMISTLKGLQELIPSLRTSSATDAEKVTWSLAAASLAELEHRRHDLEASCQQLNNIFEDLGVFVLANIEDRIKILVNETLQKQRSSSVLHSWEDLEAELVDGQEIMQRDVQEHKEAIESFLKVLRETVWGLEDDQASRNYRSSSVGDSISHTGGLGLVFDEPVGKHSSSSVTTVSQQPGKSLSSLTESDDLEIRPGRIVESERVSRPKRTSVLFVDFNNTIRSPMAQCYLEYLISHNPTLSTSFSRVLSRGIYASKPGVGLDPGVDFMLRDEGISQTFARTHTSRRLERRDVEKFEYVLVMDTAMRSEILNRWPTRDSLSPEELSNPDLITREDLMGKVLELGSFGGDGVREVAATESIRGNYWFHTGAKRIYPGFELCFSQIKSYMADFVLEVAGIDVHARAMSSSQEIDSRNTSHEVSEDEGYSGVFQSSSWIADERSGFEELSRVVSEYSGSSKDLTNLDESPWLVTIMADRHVPEESDEQLLHKHHEQFHRLVTLLLTDIGDSDLSSLRHRVLEWESDSSRNVLPVQSAHVHWFLEKIETDSSEACKLCQASGTKCGFVCDAKLEVITAEEADTIARFLEIAIQQSKEISSLSPEEDEQLRKIRDAPSAGVTAPPSIRDDVSVSVRHDKPQLFHEVSKIREREALNRLNYSAAKQSERNGSNEHAGPSIRALVRRKTDEISVRIMDPPYTADNRKDSNGTVTPSAGAGGARSRQIEQARQEFSQKAAEARTPKTPGRGPKRSLDLLKPVAVLFLSSWNTYTVIMAEVYLASRVSRSLKLACKLCDIVSAGVVEIPADQKFNPMKLERLFRNHKILESWPRKPQRLLMADDVIEFDHIIILDEDVDLEAPYLEWQKENPDEAKELLSSGSEWKKNFRARVTMLRDYDPDEKKRTVPIWDPAPGVAGLTSKSKLGVPMAAFEKRYDRVNRCVDSWLRKVIGFDVEENKFL